MWQPSRNANNSNPLYTLYERLKCRHLTRLWLWSIITWDFSFWPCNPSKSYSLTRLRLIHVQSECRYCIISVVMCCRWWLYISFLDENDVKRLKDHLKYTTTRTQGIFIFGCAISTGMDFDLFGLAFLILFILSILAAVFCIQRSLAMLAIIWLKPYCATTNVITNGCG